MNHHDIDLHIYIVLYYSILQLDNADLEFPKVSTVDTVKVKKTCLVLFMCF